MHTYLISDDDLRAYCSDFLGRLDELVPDSQLVWVTLGLSGDKIADVLDELLENQKRDTPPVVMASFKRDTGEIAFRSERAQDELARAAKSGLPVVLLDSAVHSGGSMRHV